MSHVTDVKLKIRDLESLKEAAEKCGLELREGQKTYAWWGTYLGDSHQFGSHDPTQFGKCEHALRVPGEHPCNGSTGPWEIGVVPALDGDGYELLYDTYGGAGRRLTERVGKNADKLRREYAAASASRKARAALSKKGFTITREDLANGGIRLRLKRR